MAAIGVCPGYFRTREDAITEIMKDGFWPVSWIDRPGASYEPHCHRDEETLYLIEGSLEFTDLVVGKTYHLTAGDKLLLPARASHSVQTRDGATYIMGIRTLVAFDDHFLPPG